MYDFSSSPTDGLSFANQRVHRTNFDIVVAIVTMKIKSNLVHSNITHMIVHKNLKTSVKVSESPKKWSMFTNIKTTIARVALSVPSTQEGFISEVQQVLAAS